MLRRVCLVLLPCLLHLALGRPCPAQSDSGTQPQSAPELKLRPTSVPETKQAANQVKEGRIHLDVRVTDGSGKPVTGLTREDFTLLDNNRTQPILSFSEADDQLPNSAPPAEVILLIDTVNSGLVQVDLVRNAIEKFLRQNGGKLAQPTSVFWFTDAGVKVMPKPTRDGNALANMVQQIDPSIHSIRSAAGSEALLERLQLSVRSLSLIVNNEIKKPGRKILIWTGPGWPLMAGEPTLYSARSHQLNFDSIVLLSAGLRQSRMELCGPGAGSDYYVKDFLKGVKTAREAGSGDLALQVLAVQSGGRTLDAGNGSQLVNGISECASEAGSFYTLSFDPPRPDHAEEYHDLKIRIDKPGLNARTTTGYYGEQ
jgi:VWFA-related protein